MWLLLQTVEEHFQHSHDMAMRLLRHLAAHCYSPNTQTCDAAHFLLRACCYMGHKGEGRVAEAMHEVTSSRLPFLEDEWLQAKRCMAYIRTYARELTQIQRQQQHNPLLRIRRVFMLFTRLS